MRKESKSKGTLSNRDGSKTISIEEFDKRFDAGDPSVEEFLDSSTTHHPGLKLRNPPKRKGSRIPS
jgi:hypothetical protein